MQPKVLTRGRAFHARVEADWKNTAKDGEVRLEKTIPLLQNPGEAQRVRRGRMDLFVEELGDFVCIVEIKSTDWDAVKPQNRRKLMGAHRRQIWKYIDEYLMTHELEVCPGIIYPKPPNTAGLRVEVETFMSEYGLQVVWYDE